MIETQESALIREAALALLALADHKACNPPVPNVVDFHADPPESPGSGQNITLYWTITGATFAWIRFGVNGNEFVVSNTTGNYVTAPTETIEYTLRAIDASGRENRQTITVVVP